MPLTSPYTSRSVGPVLPSGTPGNPSGGRVAYNGSSRTLGSPCMNAFSPSANVPSDVVDARICSVMLMDDSSGVWATALNLVYIRILETVHAPSGLRLVPSVCLLPTQNKARGYHTFTMFFSYHIRLHGVYDGHRLKIDYSLPFGFECFRKLHSFFGRKVVPRYLVGVPSTGRRNRKSSVFLAFPDVEASSILPCFLDVHRSFTFGRHPSSVSVALHRHFVVSRRSFLGHAQVESLSSWIVTYSCTHLFELRRACFGGMKRDNGIHLSQLVSAFSHAVPPSTRGPRMRPDDVSGNLYLLEIEPCDH